MVVKKRTPSYRLTNLILPRNIAIMTKRLINKSLLVVLLSSILVACNLPQDTAAANDPSLTDHANSVVTPTYVHHKKHIANSNTTNSTTTADPPNHADPSAGLTSDPVAADPPANKPSTGLLNFFSHNTDQNDLWGALRSGFQLQHYENTPQVQEQIGWFMHNQNYLYRTTNRAAPYMYYIYQQVQQRHLPTELVLLPILESAYNPFASSNRGATGLWQLERGTASAFGVKQDWWYDGRRDVLASTNAALDYLTYLQNFFSDNWYLALAAYDSGEGTVQEAMRRNIRDGYSTDYWSLPLPMETRSYVPRLLALAAIIEDPDKYHIRLPAINNSPYLGAVDIGGQIDLNEAAQLANISLDELKQLNPGYVHYTTDPQGPHKLLLPFDKIQTFQENLLNISKTEKTTSWVHYKVHRGDTLESVAQRFDTSVNLLQQINHLHSYKLVHVRMLLIPYVNTAQVASNSENNAATNNINTDNNSAIVNADNAAAQAAQQQAASQNTNNMVVDNSTTDSSNAAQTNNANTENATADYASTTADENNSSQNTISSTENNAASMSPETVTHIIRKGETLAIIARHYHVSINDLRRWNHINPTHMKPGMKLTIVYASTSLTNHAVNNLQNNSSHYHRKVHTTTTHHLTHTSVTVHHGVHKPVTKKTTVQHKKIQKKPVKKPTNPVVNNT